MFFDIRCIGFTSWRSKFLALIDQLLHHTFVPRIRYLGFTTRGKKGALTTTGDLSACKSTWSLIWLYTVNSLDVADKCCWVLQTLNFNVTDFEFQCCRHVMLGVVSRGDEGTWCWVLQTLSSMLQMLSFDVADMWCWGSWCSMLHATQVATWSQHGSFGCCARARREEAPEAHNMLATFLTWL
jgi:hypothetical protein